mmetsp:Transcript_39639/g.90719  ORF Transcript_39639/g.90719 Transcript_39639/m.90719 type:complete len:1180 (-) Transcript_39639:2314-5853(-)
MHRPHVHRVVLRRGAHPPGAQLGHHVLVAEAHFEGASGPELDVPVPQDLIPGVAHICGGQQPARRRERRHRLLSRSSQPTGSSDLVVEIVARVGVKTVWHQGLAIHGVKEAPVHRCMHIDSVAAFHQQAQRLASRHREAQRRRGGVVVAHVMAIAEAIGPFAGRVQCALGITLVLVGVPSGHRSNINIVRRAVRRRGHRESLLLAPGGRRDVPLLGVVAGGVVKCVHWHPGVEKRHGRGLQGAPGGRLAVAAGGGGLGGEVWYRQGLCGATHAADPLAVHHHNAILQIIQPRPQHLDRLPRLRPQHPIHPHVRPLGHHQRPHVPGKRRRPRRRAAHHLPRPRPAQVLGEERGVVVAAGRRPRPAEQTQVVVPVGGEVLAPGGGVAGVAALGRGEAEVLGGGVHGVRVEGVAVAPPAAAPAAAPGVALGGLVAGVPVTDGHGPGHGEGAVLLDTVGRAISSGGDINPSPSREGRLVVAVADVVVPCPGGVRDGHLEGIPFGGGGSLVHLHAAVCRPKFKIRRRHRPAGHPGAALHKRNGIRGRQMQLETSKSERVLLARASAEHEVAEDGTLVGEISLLPGDGQQDAAAVGLRDGPESGGPGPVVKADGVVLLHLGGSQPSGLVKQSDGAPGGGIGVGESISRPRVRGGLGDPGVLEEDLGVSKLHLTTPEPSLHHLEPPSSRIRVRGEARPGDGQIHGRGLPRQLRVPGRQRQGPGERRPLHVQPGRHLVPAVPVVGESPVVAHDVGLGFGGGGDPDVAPGGLGLRGAAGLRGAEVGLAAPDPTHHRGLGVVGAGGSLAVLNDLHPLPGSCAVEQIRLGGQVDPGDREVKVGVRLDDLLGQAGQTEACVPGDPLGRHVVAVAALHGLDVQLQEASQGLGVVLPGPAPILDLVDTELLAVAGGGDVALEGQQLPEDVQVALAADGDEGGHGRAGLAVLQGGRVASLVREIGLEHVGRDRCDVLLILGELHGPVLCPPHDMGRRGLHLGGGVGPVLLPPPEELHAAREILLVLRGAAGVRGPRGDLHALHVNGLRGLHRKIHDNSVTVGLIHRVGVAVQALAPELGFHDGIASVGCQERLVHPLDRGIRVVGHSGLPERRVRLRDDHSRPVGSHDGGGALIIGKDLDLPDPPTVVHASAVGEAEIVGLRHVRLLHADLRGLTVHHLEGAQAAGQVVLHLVA